jgi:hypothetical protein
MRRQFDDLLETLFILHSCDVSHLGAAQNLPEDVVASAVVAMRPQPRPQGTVPGPQSNASMTVTKPVQPVPLRAPVHQWPQGPSSPQAASSAAVSRNSLAPTQPVLMPWNYVSRHLSGLSAGRGNGDVSGGGQGGSAAHEEGSCGSIDPRPQYITRLAPAGTVKAAGAHTLNPTHLPMQRWDPAASASACTETAGQSELPATQPLEATQECTPVGPTGGAGIATSFRLVARQRGRGGLPSQIGGVQFQALHAAEVCRPWGVQGGVGPQEEVESTLRQEAAFGKRQKLLEGSSGNENTPR